MTIFNKDVYRWQYSLLYRTWSDMISTEYAFYFRKMIDDLSAELAKLDYELQCNSNTGTE